MQKAVSVLCSIFLECTDDDPVLTTVLWTSVLKFIRKNRPAVRVEGSNYLP